MNGIDIVAGAILLWAVFAGWRRGLLQQLFSLAGIVAGIWLAARYGAATGALLHVDPAFSTAAGFVIVLVLAMIAVGVIGQLLRKLFRLAGFGALDALLGIVISIAKWLLIMSVIFCTVDRFDTQGDIIGKSTRRQSLAFRSLSPLPQHLLPFVERWIDIDIDLTPEKADETDEADENPQNKIDEQSV